MTGDLMTARIGQWHSGEEYVHREFVGRPAPLHHWLLAALLMLIGVSMPRMAASAAASWWNGDWQYRKAITVRLPAATTGSAPSVVLPIRLHAGNFNFFQDVQPNGADLRFISDDGTPLKYQLELLDPVVGLLVAWIDLPVKAGATEQSIFMYYGNARATAPDNYVLYDGDQVLVLHFGESQGLPKDATANHYDVTASTALLGTPGVIGNGARLDGHGAVRIAAHPGLALAENGGFTFAA